MASPNKQTPLSISLAIFEAQPHRNHVQTSTFSVSERTNSHDELDAKSGGDRTDSF